jgi:dCMP deaminase
LIIGITGMYCSGKDVVSDYLVKKGFHHFSLSDLIREELGRRGIEVTRDNLINVANEMRDNLGHGVLGERALEKMQSKAGNFAINSIRHPAEVEELKKAGSFFMIEVRAPIEMRFKRIKKRKREKDPDTLAELKKKEKLESQTEGPGQQLTNVIKMANAVVENKGSLKELHKKLDRLLRDLRKKETDMPHPLRLTKDQLGQLKSERPEKIKYYMNIAKEVSARSNCLTTKHGAIIVRDDQIVATGYNGAPRKVRDCMERGTCLRRELRIPSGQRYELCRTVHAEANAIINAARAGVSLLKGDLYIYSEKVWKDERKIVNAHPCFICKKLVINAGIRDVYCMQEDSSVKKYSVQEWVNAWRRGDMTDDMNIYDSNYAGMSDRKVG